MPPKSTSYSCPKRLRQEVLRRDGHICTYCGKFAKELDHVIHWRQGGPTRRWNAVAYCSSCNNLKGWNVDYPFVAIGLQRLIDRGEWMNWLDDPRWPEYTFMLYHPATSVDF